MGLLTEEQRARVDRHRAQTEHVQKSNAANEAIEDGPITLALKKSVILSCGQNRTARHSDPPANRIQQISGGRSHSFQGEQPRRIDNNHKPEAGPIVSDSDTCPGLVKYLGQSMATVLPVHQIVGSSPLDWPRQSYGNKDGILNGSIFSRKIYQDGWKQ